MMARYTSAKATGAAVTPRAQLIGVVLFAGIAVSGCTSGSRCWVTPDVASSTPSLLSMPADADQVSLYRAVGVYRAGWEQSLLALDWSEPIYDVPLVTSIDFCVRIAPDCRRVVWKETDVPGEYVGYYSNLARVDALVRFIASARGFDCPLGTVVIEQLVAVERPSPQDFEALRRRVESER